MSVWFGNGRVSDLQIEIERSNEEGIDNDLDYTTVHEDSSYLYEFEKEEIEKNER